MVSKLRLLILLLLHGKLFHSLAFDLRHIVGLGVKKYLLVPCQPVLNQKLKERYQDNRLREILETNLPSFGAAA